MSIITPNFGIEAPSGITKLKELGAQVEAFARSVDDVLHEFDYNGADPNLVLSRVTALETTATNLANDLADQEDRLTDIESLADSHVQLNTTNSVQRMVTQYGIGFITATAVASISKTITFPRPFASIPIFDASYIGGKNSIVFDPSDLVDVTFSTVGKGIGPSISGGTVVIHRTDAANMSAGWRYYFSWRATGVLA